MDFQKEALPHFNSLYNFALSISYNSQDAEDLVQETFLRAQAKFDQFDYGTNCKAWMFRIMRNIAIDQLKKKDALIAGKNEPFEDNRSSSSCQIEKTLATLDLKRAFAKLPKKYRLMILLKDVEGFSYQEIADILQFPVGTVMSRLYRGRKELYSLLTADRKTVKKIKIMSIKK